MDKVNRIILAFSVLFVINACSNFDLQTEETTVSPKEWKVSIRATKGDDTALTKTLNESGNTITASWEAGDVVYIYRSSSSYGQLTAQSSGTSTTLVGTITGTMTVGKTYTLRYLQRGNKTFDLRSQNGTLENISKNHDMAEATVTVKSIDGGTVVFEETSVQFESKISITKFTFDRNIARVDIISSNLLAYNEPGYSSNHNYINVKPAAETQTVYVAMSNLEAKKADFLFLAKGADGNYYTAVKRVQLANGKNYATTVTLQAIPEYVDLGIVRDEHAVCWATKNLGASNPIQVGSYYAWAETETKATYSWDNYKYGKYNKVTKYCDRSDQGTVVDNKYSLEADDDAATSSLGAGWRTPSPDDITDLLNDSNTERMYVVADGRWGYVFHSKISGYTSNFIFLPHTSGYFKGDHLSSASPDYEYGGYYWSNKIETNTWTSASHANALEIKSSSAPSLATMMQRAYGLVVRPVYVKSL